MKTLTITLALMGILAGSCTAEASTGIRTRNQRFASY